MPSKIGRCIDCKNFLKTDPDPKECSCTKYYNYITKNALRYQYCQYYDGFTNEHVAEFQRLNQIFDKLRELVELGCSVTQESSRIIKVDTNQKIGYELT